MLDHNYVLPMVDISKLSSSSLVERMKVAKALDAACKQVGFLYIKGDQFNADAFEQLVAISKAYFAQNDAEKMQDYIGHSKNHSGYVPIGEEQFKANSYDLKESYDVNYDYPLNEGLRPLLGPTLWTEFPDFKSVVSNYYQHTKFIGHQLFSSFALALGLDEKFFDAHLQHPPSQLRLIHYPYNPTAEDSIGIGAHTDYECFTLLLPTAPGLQVLNKKGEWIDVPLIKNTIVMNIGDMMEVLSNGRYIATKHRVKRVQEERYSFPLFFSCDYDYLIESVIPNEAPKYQPLKGGEHLFNQTAQTFSYLKKKVMRGDIKLSNAIPLSSFGLSEKEG